MKTLQESGWVIELAYEADVSVSSTQSKASDFSTTQMHLMEGI